MVNPKSNPNESPTEFILSPKLPSPIASLNAPPMFEFKLISAGSGKAPCLLKRDNPEAAIWVLKVRGL